MDIDITSIIIGIIAFSFFLGPVFYYEYYKKRSTEKFKRHFMELAQKQSLTLTQHDIWQERYAIGLDQIAGKIFYLKRKDGEDSTRLISLSEIEKCRVSKDDNKVKTTNGYTRLTTRIDLNLILPDPDKPGLHLEFYREADGTDLREELPLVEKWSALINSCLRR